MNRREFLTTASISTFAAATSGAFGRSQVLSRKAGKLAILGGQPIRTTHFPSWPMINQNDEQAVLSALRSGHWSRGKLVDKVEKRFGDMMGAKHCLLTGSGTQSLNTSVHVLGIGAGDEVLVTPYTFVATVEAILLEDALPVFVDIDPDTFQIDPDKMEAKITRNTKAIMPVHITGGVAHMDKINAVARKHNLKVIEDACQAVMAEWKKKKVGNWSDLGCISFQTSKGLTCGEGGAILGEDEKIMDLCYSFHNFGRPHGKYMSRSRGGHPILGTKYRTSTINAALLDSQMNLVEQHTARKEENADYLTAKLKQIPGIIPRKDYEDTTRTAYNTYGFRYKKEFFNGLPRQKFLSALKAEGIPCSWGLGVIEGRPIHKEGIIEDTLNSETCKKIYSQKRLKQYFEQNQCPQCDRLCEEVAGFSGSMLLASKSDMDDIYNAIMKIYENRNQLSQSG